MGIKGDKKNPTNEQARMARLTLEGNSADDDFQKIQKLIKKIIEMTRCTQSEAEIALLDNDNDIHAAIEHILDNEKLDSWTDPKAAKKEKKSVNDERPQNRTFVPRGRGTNGFSERGGRGRSNGAPRENRENGKEVVSNSNGAPTSTHRGRGGFDRSSTFSGRGGRGGGRGGYSRAVAPESSVPPALDEVPETPKVETVVNEVSKPVEESVSTTVTTSTAPGPISFAAVAARGNRKEELRKQNLHTPSVPETNVSKRRSVSPVPPANEVPHSYEEAEPSNQNEEKVDVSFYQSEQSALVEEPEINVSKNDVENVQSSPAQATAWTKQLKSELGIGVPESSSTFAPTSPIPSNVSLPDPGVEFIGVDPVGLNEYSFGYVDQPQPTQILPPAETSVASISTNNSDNIFNSSRISAVPSKSVEAERSLQNGEFNLKSQSPPSSYGQQNRTLSYDTSSVSYTPKERSLGNTQFNQQLPVHQQPQQQQQQAPQPPQQSQAPQQQQPPQQPAQQQQHHPQLMFPPQNFPYGPYSYMNMYNPVRDDQYAALMQYGMGVDLSNLSTILPQQTAPTAPTQLPTGQQRGETHGLMDFNKFGTQGTRDQQQQQQQQQPSNVGPPPGFQTTSYVQQPLSSLFMQQPYAAPHAAFGFMNMMPSVGNNGGARQMYGQDDDRKSYDKMSAKPATPQNPHSQYQHNGANLGMYGAGQKNKYNWAS